MWVTAGGGQIVGAVAVALEMQQAVADLDRHAVQTDGRVGSAVVVAPPLQDDSTARSPPLSSNHASRFARYPSGLLHW